MLATDAGFEVAHVAISVGTILVTGILAYVGLKIRLEISESNRINSIAQIKLEGRLDGHIVVDETKHHEIDRHLEVTDSRVTRLENVRHRIGGGLE